MEVPPWLASVSMAAFFGFLMYIYKDFRAHVVAFAKIASQLEDIRDRVKQIEQKLNQLPPK